MNDNPYTTLFGKKPLQIIPRPTQSTEIIVELNSASDIMTDLAASLASEHPLALIFQNAKINLSFFGIGLEVKGTVPITNIQVAITKMLESLKNKIRRSSFV